MKKYKWLLIPALFIIIIIISLPYFKILLFMINDFINPNWFQKLQQEYKNKPTQYLIEVFKKGGRGSEAAAAILPERNDTDFFNILKDTIENSKDQSMRSDAIKILVKKSDERSIPLLLNIVKKGRTEPQYLNAMKGLSQFSYEPIYLDILQMARDNFHTPWVIDMLVKFPSKPETLSTLKEIAVNNPDWYTKNRAKEAIQTLDKSSQTK